MFLSSIFSSRTLSLSGSGRSQSLKTVALTLTLVAVAEGVARSALVPIGDYWQYWEPQAAAKLETYRRNLHEGVVPRLLVVGDSTAARDIDPELFKAAGFETSFNLSWPANFPVAFKQCTLPLLRNSRVPDTVVASFNPGGFVDSLRVERSEEAILSSHYCRQLQGESSAADFSYLARLRPALPFVRSWWSGEMLPRSTRAGFMPLNGKDDSDVDVVDDFEGGISPERFGAIREFFQTGKQYGFRAVIVVPPRVTPSSSRLGEEQNYIDNLTTAGFSFLDYRDAPFLRRDHFFDGTHLNQEGARIFSEQLARDLQRLPR